MKKCQVVTLTSAVAVAVSLGGCGYQSGHMGATAIPAKFSSNGERIYFTGTSERNTVVSSTGGGMHMRMMGGACANCHGPDRRGNIRMMPYFWKTAPPLTAHALFSSQGENGDGHGDHGVYNEPTLRRAITTGTDPSGRELDELMPRWIMTDKDLDDLIVFLKS